MRASSWSLRNAFKEAIVIEQALRKTIRKVRSIKELCRPYLKNLALDLGVIDGSSSYTKFIVLGRSRVGSNFLLGLLNSHSRILAFGELLSDPNNMQVKVPDPVRSFRLLAGGQNDPVRFLEDGVFRKYPPHICAVGFKLFYYHAQCENWKPTWKYLEEHKEIKIVHLKRHNILKTHLSWKKAALTSQWVETAGAKTDGRSLALDYQECLKDFISTREWEQEYDLFFKNHPKLEVLYENLESDYESEMKRIQAFLGVDYEAVKPATHKQASQSLSNAISNHRELKEQFKHTPWEAFFEE
jgi:hypothetical protein